jgi:hypothetical protein
MIYKSFHDWIIQHIEHGSNMLEFGSGQGTSLFTKYFNVTSIEHDNKFVGLAKESNYIHAPIVNGWYDIEELTQLKDKVYDVILVDGPTGVIGRSGFIKNMGLFNLNTIIVMDDLNRVAELSIFNQTVKLLGNPTIEIFTGVDRDFGIIYNKIK